MKIIISCWLVFSLCICATCNKRIDCNQTIYSFQGNYKAYPDLDSIHINDTIWLDSNISIQLKDLMTNHIVDYSGAENFGPSLSYIELVGGTILNPGGIPAANSFENLLLKGAMIESPKPDQVRGFLFKEEGGIYLFKLGIIPKVKGLFAIAPSDAGGVYRRTNKCDKELLV